MNNNDNVPVDGVLWLVTALLGLAQQLLSVFLCVSEEKLKV